MEEERSNVFSLKWFTDLMEGRDPDAWAERLRETSHRTEELIMALDFAMLTYRNLAKEEGHRSWRQYDALYSKYGIGVNLDQDTGRHLQKGCLFSCLENTKIRTWNCSFALTKNY